MSGSAPEAPSLFFTKTELNKKTTSAITEHTRNVGVGSSETEHNNVVGAVFLLYLKYTMLMACIAITIEMKIC